MKVAMSILLVRRGCDRRLKPDLKFVLVAWLAWKFRLCCSEGRVVRCLQSAISARVGFFAHRNEVPVHRVHVNLPRLGSNYEQHDGRYPTRSTALVMKREAQPVFRKMVRIRLVALWLDWDLTGSANHLGGGKVHCPRSCDHEFARVLRRGAVPGRDGDWCDRVENTAFVAGECGLVLSVRYRSSVACTIIRSMRYAHIWPAMLGINSPSGRMRLNGSRSADPSWRNVDCCGSPSTSWCCETREETDLIPVGFSSDSSAEYRITLRSVTSSREDGL